MGRGIRKDTLTKVTTRSKKPGSVRVTLLEDLPIETISESDGEMKLNNLLNSRLEYVKSSQLKTNSEISDEFETSLAELYWDLAMEADQVEAGAFRTVFIYKDKVIKLPYIPRRDRVAPVSHQHLSSLLAQYTEEYQVKNKTYEIPPAQTELVYSRTGIPLIIMDRVKPTHLNPLDHPYDFKDYDLSKPEELDPEEEVYTQIGKDENGQFFLYDLGDWWQPNQNANHSNKFGPEFAEFLPDFIVKHCRKTHLAVLFDKWA